MTLWPPFSFRLSALACALCAAGLSPAAAAIPPWAGLPYDYVVLDQDIRTALTEFGRNMGVAVALTDGVKGRVHGRIEAPNAVGFLDAIANANGLVWYYDGAVLNVSAASEYATRTLSSGRMTGAAVTREMEGMGLADPRFGLRGSEDGRMILVSGPPAYVAMVEAFVRDMQPAEGPVGDDPRVRVYRGGKGVEDVATLTTQDDPQP
ncbi:hypothetical protein [Falsirhodobacter sp. 20TX0035]|uniref:hypothetical protein n=1 Tax=Falsirhodobacter sp. 20TX0035 TaxID=3022019 RepID=UPI00232F57C9|nr:hypothetical protein [Falsirhodobacter sp. 20TX0035]MDB6454407.1 hypothetical protein [Falsirhodobacter sp. 20TX0035]